jgi:hypothetical protein
MPADRKTELRKLRDEIGEGLLQSLSHLKARGFRRRGRGWQRPHNDAEGPATDLIDFELKVLKASVRVTMYEMRWVETRRKTAMGAQTGRLEGTDGTLEWKLTSREEMAALLTAVIDRVERITLPWFAAGGNPSGAVETYSLDDFLEASDSKIE